MIFVRVFLVALVCSSAAAIAAPDRAYHSTTTCDGWPRAPIGTAKGYCAGMVLAPPARFAQRQLVFPRMLLQLRPRAWLVTDMVGWYDGRGAVYRLDIAHDHTTRLTKLLARLSMPHTIARGPDGKIYVGEMSRILRFDPNAANPESTIEPMITGLPDNRLHTNRHPLSSFIFDANGDLLVNVGAPTDQCVASARAGARRCEETEGAEQTGGVRRYAYLGRGKWSPRFTMFARGLRNSLALVRHSSGTIIQAENSIDFSSADSPFEELNVLHAGGHYGWPYCFDMVRETPAWAWAHIDCRIGYERPARLLPPHAAPLSMLHYDGAMFPELAGRLLMAWHGYRPTGARIVAFAVDVKGVPVLTPRARYASYSTGASVDWHFYPGPASEPLILTPEWDKRAGVRPMGTPVGLAVADDGAIWVTEDKNATILRIAPDRP